jgi:hypothetical protein
MKEPANLTLEFLREIRAAISSMDTRLPSMINKNHEELTDEIDSIGEFMVGESVLGRYAAVDVDKRLAALEKRMAVLEKRR